MSFRIKWIIRSLLSFCGKDYLLNLLAHCAPEQLVPSFHKLRGVKIGNGVIIHRSVYIDETFPFNITIEDYVRIAPGAVVISHMNPPQYLTANYNMPNRKTKVRLCKHSYIGINAVIMPGVTIGQGAIVISGSVVMTNVEPFTIVMGIPAKKIKNLQPKEAACDGTGDNYPKAL